MRSGVFALALVAACFFAPIALAQADRDDEDWRRPLPPPHRKKILVSAGVGAGLFDAASGAETDRRHFSGKTLSLAFLGGGHADARTSFGAAYLRDQVFGLRAKDDFVDGDEPALEDITFYLNTIAVFCDVMLVEQPELHLQAFAGRGWLGVLGRRGKSSEVDDPSGFVLAGAFSAEHRVGERFAVGGAFRLTWAPFSVEEAPGAGTDVTIVVPALLLTGRYD